MLLVNPCASICLRPVLRLLLVAACVGCVTAGRVLADEPPTDSQTVDSQPQSAASPAAIESPPEDAAEDATENATENTAEAPAESLDPSTTNKSTRSREGSSTAKKSPRSAGGSAAKRRGTASRLPAYYASIVDERQRQAIYEIRGRVAVELEQLQQQLDALRRAEMSEIEALLTPAQHQQLDALRAQRSQIAGPQAGT